MKKPYTSTVFGLRANPVKRLTRLSCSLMLRIKSSKYLKLSQSCSSLPLVVTTWLRKYLHDPLLSRNLVIPMIAHEGATDATSNPGIISISAHLLGHFILHKLFYRLEMTLVHGCHISGPFRWGCHAAVTWIHAISVLVCLVIIQFLCKCWIYFICIFLGLPLSANLKWLGHSAAARRLLFGWSSLAMGLVLRVLKLEIVWVIRSRSHYLTIFVCTQGWRSSLGWVQHAHK